MSYRGKFPAAGFTITAHEVIGGLAVLAVLIVLICAIRDVRRMRRSAMYWLAALAIVPIIAVLALFVVPPSNDSLFPNNQLPPCSAYGQTLYVNGTVAECFFTSTEPGRWTVHSTIHPMSSSWKVDAAYSYRLGIARCTKLPCLRSKEPPTTLIAINDHGLGAFRIAVPGTSTWVLTVAQLPPSSLGAALGAAWLRHPFLWLLAWLVLGVNALVCGLLGLRIYRRLRSEADDAVRGSDLAGPDRQLARSMQLRDAVDLARRNLDKSSSRWSVIACWQDVEESASDLGCERSPEESPREFAGRVGKLLGNDVAVQQLRVLYEAARYSSSLVDQASEEAAQAELSHIQSGLDPARQT